MVIYNLDVILDILESFNVNSIVITGLTDCNIVKKILNYDASFTIFNHDDSQEFESKIRIVNEFPLKILSKFEDYDAFFINDDPNWYTVYNELKIIKEKNTKFPLVFICNNKFPHKYADSYLFPNNIPNEFKHEFNKELNISYKNKKITISDGFYHACSENTDKNGVSTAIKDFLDENGNIEVMDIKLIKGITVLYPKSPINKFRINKLKEKISDEELNINLSDNILENEILFNYINQNRISNNSFKLIDDLKSENLQNKELIDDLKSENLQNEDLIKDYKQKVRNQQKEIDYKNSKILSIESDLNLKNSQITILNKKITTLKEDFYGKENSLNKQLHGNKTTIDSLKTQINKKIIELNNNEYCVSCFKEEIKNNHSEIKYLKNSHSIKKIISKFSYLYLIFKSRPKEIPINIKLFKSLKNSKFFDIGFYLNNNPDIQNSKWLKYFSPELHYVCKGFSENRRFNKKYFNTNSKKELFEYLSNCEKKI